MVDLQKLVEKELVSEANSTDLISLCSNIFEWYEEGGPENVENNLIKHLREVDSAVSKNIKGISPEVKIRKKKTKKRRKS